MEDVDLDEIVVQGLREAVDLQGGIALKTLSIQRCDTVGEVDIAAFHPGSHGCSRRGRARTDERKPDLLPWEGTRVLSRRASILVEPLHDKLTLRRIAHDLVRTRADGLLEPGGLSKSLHGLLRYDESAGGVGQ